MQTTYIVEFKTTKGTTYEFEFITADIHKNIKEEYQKRDIVSHEIKEQYTQPTKKILLG